MRSVAFVIALLFVLGCAAEHSPEERHVSLSVDSTLSFIHDGEKVATLSLATLLERVESEEWTAFDPYYNRKKSWKTIPLAAVLAEGFKGRDIRFQDVEFAFRASDGYEVPFAGSQVTEPGAYVAYQDQDVPGWEPIGPTAAHPGPFYLVWRLEHQQDLVHYPRPWQLAEIEISPFEKRYPLTIPTGLEAEHPATLGFNIFRKQCLKCHAMNRQGGRVGPELNVPMSIVEYRDLAQLKSYIREPERFRYTAMPAHPGLSDQDLDHLIAYFDAMRLRKVDPRAPKAPVTP